MVNHHFHSFPTRQICLSDKPDSAALKNTVDSSIGGGVKLTSLIGNLLHHKNGETGYQDCHLMFMEEEQCKIHSLNEKEKIANTSSVHYQSYTYASAEIACFYASYMKLIQQTVDEKIASGV